MILVMGHWGRLGIGRCTFRPARSAPAVRDLPPSGDAWFEKWAGAAHADRLGNKLWVMNDTMKSGGMLHIVAR